jgi:hypothetical protein
MRTQQEIVDRFNERREEDFFGFEIGEYVDFLDFENAKEFLKDEVDAEQWKLAQKENTREVILKIMEDYMEFAWTKANNCRGISAGRSIGHYQAWVWLLGDEDVKALGILWMDYEYYGKAELVAICERFGWDWKQWDDDSWCNGEEGPFLTAAEVLNA